MSAVRFSVHKKFHLFQSKTRTWESKAEDLDHYRLVFILSGEGRFVLDSQIYPYSKQAIVFLRPGQHPIFEEGNDTELLVLVFDTYLADDFQKKKAFSPDFADTYKQAENLCENLKLTQGKELMNVRDGQTISYLINQIIFEVTQQPASHTKLVRSSIDLIVTVLARNNFESKKIEENTDQQILTENIVEYLRDQLHQNKNIRLPEVLLRFNISEETANLLLMNKTGMSVRNFIFKYKADLFKSRMLKVDIMEISPYLRPRQISHT